MFGIGTPELLLISLVCLAIGVLMGRPYGQALEGGVWGFFLGPIGLLLFAVFFLRNAQPRHPDQEHL